MPCSAWSAHYSRAIIHSVHSSALLFPLHQQTDFQNKLQSHMQALQLKLDTVRDIPSKHVSLPPFHCQLVTCPLLLCLLRQELISFAPPSCPSPPSSSPPHPQDHTSGVRPPLNLQADVKGPILAAPNPIALPPGMPRKYDPHTYHYYYYYYYQFLFQASMRGTTGPPPLGTGRTFSQLPASVATGMEDPRDYVNDYDENLIFDIGPNPVDGTRAGPIMKPLQFFGRRDFILLPQGPKLLLPNPASPTEICF
jgi:hypothetical protein